MFATWTVPALAAAAMLAAPATGMTVVYQNDFETTPAGAEWSHTDMTTSPSGETFLGNFGAHGVDLTLTDLPEHTSITVTFDLYLIKSWDGVGPAGEDSWSLGVDGSQVFESTFSNAADVEGEGQHFPSTTSSRDDIHAPRSGASANNTLGYTFARNAADSIYSFSFTVEHVGEQAVIRFAGAGLEHLGNESWGIDNLTVSAIGEPIPAPGAAALIGLGGLAAARRRR